MRRSFLGLGLMVMVTILMIGGLGDIASGQIMPSFTWQMETSKNVDVSPGSSGTVTFTGTLTVNSGSQPQLMCYLEVQVAGWGSTISPSVAVVASPEATETFQVSVTVVAPIGAPRQVKDVVVSGRWESGAGLAGTIPNQKMVALVMPYYMMDVSSSNPTVQVNPGDAITFNLKISNQGNDQDRYRVSVANLKSLSDDGWSVPTIGTVTLLSKEEKSIQIRVETPQDWTVWKNELKGIQVVVTSEFSELAGAEVPVTYQYTLYCRQKGMYLPAYDPLILVSGIAVAMLLFGGRRQRQRE